MNQNQVKLYFSDDELKTLTAIADERHLPLTEYMRIALLEGNQHVVQPFSVEDVFERALKLESGTVFSLPYLYTEDEWLLLGTRAGVFGRSVFSFVDSHDDCELEFVRMFRGLAQYRRK